jgi:hypothetical protein
MNVLNFISSRQPYVIDRHPVYRVVICFLYVSIIYFILVKQICVFFILICWNYNQKNEPYIFFLI